MDVLGKSSSIVWSEKGPISKYLKLVANSPDQAGGVIEVGDNHKVDVSKRADVNRLATELRDSKEMTQNDELYQLLKGFDRACMFRNQTIDEESRFFPGIDMTGRTTPMF